MCTNIVRYKEGYSSVWTIINIQYDSEVLCEVCSMYKYDEWAIHVMMHSYIMWQYMLWYMINSIHSMMIHALTFLHTMLFTLLRWWIHTMMLPILCSVKSKQNYLFRHCVWLRAWDVCSSESTYQWYEWWFENWSCQQQIQRLVW